MAKLFICEGKNEALLLQQIYKGKLIFKDFQHSKKDISKNEQTKIFRDYGLKRKKLGKEIAKIEGGVRKVESIIRKLILEQQIRYVDAQEVVILCDNEKGNRTLKFLRECLEKLNKMKLPFEFIENKICDYFYFLKISFEGVSIKLLIANPNLEEVVKKVTKKNLKEAKEDKEKEAILKDFLKDVKICNLISCI